jgi:hypothetical protein
MQVYVREFGSRGLFKGDRTVVLLPDAYRQPGASPATSSDPKLYVPERSDYKRSNAYIILCYHLVVYLIYPLD